MICSNCGRKPKYSTEEYQYRESGLDNVFVSNVGVFRCKCGQEYIQLPGFREVEDKIAIQLLKKPSLLIGREFKFLRKWLRLTSEQLATALGVVRGTVSRWENDDINRANDRAMRMYAASTRTVSLDAQNLFQSIAETPDQNFNIHVEGLGLATAPEVEAASLFAWNATISIELKTTPKKFPVNAYKGKLKLPGIDDLSELVA